MCFCKCCPYWCWCNKQRPPPLLVLYPPMRLQRKPRLKKTVRTNSEVYFEIIIENQLAGRIVFELYDDLVPIAADTFRSLCTGERGLGRASYKHLTYKHTKIHKIIRGNYCMGGDVSRGDGYGADGPYGRTFADETFLGKAGKIDHRGCLVLARSTDEKHGEGAGRNSSQFFIALRPMKWLDGRHVVCGQVVEGFEVLDAMEECGENLSGKTWKRVYVYDCGEVEPHAREVAKKEYRKSKAPKRKAKVAPEDAEESKT